VTVRGDEPYKELDILKDVDDITMVLHNLPCNEEKISRVHAARRQVIYRVEFINLFYNCSFIYQQFLFCFGLFV